MTQRSHFSVAPGRVGLYNPANERDSCGVGFIADIKGRASRKVVSDANKILVRMTHRGAKQGEDGDGAGILVGMPHRFFKKLSLTGQLPFLSLPPLGRYGVGMIFLPNGEENENRRFELMENIERVIRSYGLSVLGWRSPLPTKSSILGPTGRATEPFTVQIFVCRPSDNEDDEEGAFNGGNRRTHSSCFDGADSYTFEPLEDQYDLESSFSAFKPAEADASGTTIPRELPSDLERLLYLVRRKLSRWTDMYVCSFSCRLVVYKGQLQSEQLFSYYDDLMDEDFASYLAIVHARFSTNTFPTWDRAQPFRHIAHNGEINTIDCNRRWMVAKEGKASCPASLGLQLQKSDLIPFEEPCHVTRFVLPGPPDLLNDSSNRDRDRDGHQRGLPGSKRRDPASITGSCGSISRLRDTLALPTDIVSARRSSVASSNGSQDEDSSGCDDMGPHDKRQSPRKRTGGGGVRGRMDRHGEGDSWSASEVGRQQPSVEEKEEDTSPPSYSSDSASVDGALELLLMAGRDVAEAVTLLIPEAVQRTDPEWKRDYNKFVSCVMEPWDGPALLSFTDGTLLGAQLDRNGLRPGRYIISKDDRIILASEVGVVDIPPSMILKKGRLLAGKMLLIDFREGRIVSDDEVKKNIALRHPYSTWLNQYSINLDEISIAMTDDELRRELQLDPLPSPACCDRSDDLLVMRDGHAGESLGATWCSDAKRPGSSIATSVTRFSDTLGSNCTAIAPPGGSVGGSGSSVPVDTMNNSPEVDADLKSQLTLFGYSEEKVELLLGPMARYGAEVLGSMGNDAPLSCLSELPKTPGDYFQQMFAQGTNPSIDSIRETDVMSLACPIGPQEDLFTITRNHVKRVFLARPVVNPSEFRALVTLPGFPTATVDLTVPRATDNIFDLAGRLLQIQTEAEHAVRKGCRILILSDRRAGLDRLPIWSTLAVGAVHLHLIAQRIRLNCAVIVETGEASEVHQIAMLLSSGADAVYPYLAYRSLSRVQFRDDEEPLPMSRLIENYITAVHLGLLRVLSKIGVCTVLSYKGGFYFQPLGVAASVLRLCFDCGVSAIGGVGFDVFAEDTLRLHLLAYPPRPLRSLLDPSPLRALVDTGEYRLVPTSGAELHTNHPDSIAYLQAAARSNDWSSYRKFADTQNALVDEIEIRGQLEFVYGAYRAVPLDEVEPAKEIVKRFVTAAISYGSISEEAYLTIARAMNSIGSRSNTGEGGECEDALNGSDASIRNRTKQIGSGRFGVTAAYLCDADELQIKCGQGANPGEGGELPGYKVVPKVAATRRSTPGVGLISPPPHHDMYSIEDSAQLIMDLKHANPRARISVKLVAKLGIGVIAAGCVKAKVDHLVVSGASGGTAASKFSSIKHSGLPWEIGLAETHQTLCLNSLREKVALQVDGQLKTGRDVVYAALLGAEEFAFGTQPLIALGCQMTRKCHLNACPTGIATQDPELRKRFAGQPEHLVNYFFMVAEEVRTYMARLGFRHITQMIGRSDLLRPKPRLREHWKRCHLDLHQTLVPGWKLTCPMDVWRNKAEPPVPRPMYCLTAQDHEMDKVLDREIIRRARRSLEHKIPTTFLLPIRNGDRAVGGLLAYEVSSRYGSAGLPANTITINFRGSAGQSFACWLPNGVHFRLSGDCNDFVGKGLSGGIVVVKPPSESHFFPNSDKNIICGNSALYGATSGRAFFAGVAGERFAVRNSGAVAVVEGCGNYGCEYMTRGVVLILGATGRNFAAGMTGGIAYVLDLDPQMVNPQTVDLQSMGVRADESREIKDNIIGEASDVVSGMFDDQSEARAALKRRQQQLQGLGKDAKTLELLLQEHYERTKSCVAQRMLAQFQDYLPRFTKVFPKEIQRVLKQAISEYVTTGNPDAAALLDDWETMTTQALKYETMHLRSLPYALHHYMEKFQNRRQQLKRVQVLDVHENALRVLGGLETPSPLEQYVAEMMRSNRLTDLLAEENSDQLAQIMRMTRTVYAHWRAGYSKGIRKCDYEMVKNLMPAALTPSRRAVLIKFMYSEREQLREHLRALEGCKLAEQLLQQFKPTLDDQTRVLSEDTSEEQALSGQKEWEAFVGTSSPSAAAVQAILTGHTTQAQQQVTTPSSTRATTVGATELHHGQTPPPSPVASIRPPSDEGSIVENVADGIVLSRKDIATSSSQSTAGSTTNNAAATAATPRPGHVQVPGSAVSATAAAGTSLTVSHPSKPFLVRHPDKIRGFHLYDKHNPPLKSSAVRVLDWEEIALPINGTSRLYEQLMKTQAARCMDCGTPTCHFPNARGGGCPLGNRIPNWNSLVYDGQWKIALDRLLETNNFPEFTGRVCPAPCESSCVLAARDAPVAIKSIEAAIVERGFQQGWIKPMPPLKRTRFSVGIIGSGPAGLAAAQQLNRAGHRVVVFEKEDKVGGLLMYGIPNMKLDKTRILQRRIDLLVAEGIEFRRNVCVGKDVLLDNLLETFSAVLLASGQSQMRDLPIPGRHLKGIVQGIDFLKKNQKSLLGVKETSATARDASEADACGKRVIVVGSGDIAVDCIATALRMGCSEVVQFCLTTTTPKNNMSPSSYVPGSQGHVSYHDAYSTSIPQQQYTVSSNGVSVVNSSITGPLSGTASVPAFRVEYGHEEAVVLQGRDPREHRVRPLEFIEGPPGVVGGIRAIRTAPVTGVNHNGALGRGSYPTPTGHPYSQRASRFQTTAGSRRNDVGQEEISEMGPFVDFPGTERVYSVDLVILALGYEGTDSQVWAAHPPKEKSSAGSRRASVRVDGRGNIVAPTGDYRTNVKNLFACGDCRTGPSYVVTAIADGRDAARAVDDFLMQNRHLAGYQPLRGTPVEWSLPRYRDHSPSTSTLLHSAQRDHVIKSDSLPSIAPHLGVTDARATKKQDTLDHVPPPLTVALASGPVSTLPSTLAAASNPLRRPLRGSGFSGLPTTTYISYDDAFSGSSYQRR